MDVEPFTMIIVFVGVPLAFFLWQLPGLISDRTEAMEKAAADNRKAAEANLEAERLKKN